MRAMAKDRERSLRDADELLARHHRAARRSDALDRAREDHRPAPQGAAARRRRSRSSCGSRRSRRDRRGGASSIVGHDDVAARRQKQAPRSPTPRRGRGRCRAADAGDRRRAAEADVGRRRSTVHDRDRCRRARDLRESTGSSTAPRRRATFDARRATTSDGQDRRAARRLRRPASSRSTRSTRARTASRSSRSSSKKLPNGRAPQTPQTNPRSRRPAPGSAQSAPTRQPTGGELRRQSVPSRPYRPRSEAGAIAGRACSRAARSRVAHAAADAGYIGDASVTPLEIDDCPADRP